MSAVELQEAIYQWACKLQLISLNQQTKTSHLKDLKKHIENHMNPTKSKKQSAAARIGPVKPETSYFQTYPAQFSQPNICNQQINQTSQTI